MRKGVCGALVAAALCGCGSVTNSVFVHDQLDLAYVKTVAVVPFANNTGESRAGDRVLSIFCSELLSAGLLQVVDPSQTAEFMRRAKLDGGAISAADLLKFKEALGVNGVIMGSVDEYAMQSVGSDSFPVVTISARLVDVQKGTVLWMSTASGSGDAKVPILALGRVKTLPELAQAVCEHLVETLK